MQTLRDLIVEYKPEGSDGPWCLKINDVVYGPFSTYERVKEIVCSMNLESQKLYFDQIWAWRWKDWDNIFSFYTDFPIPTLARPMEEDVVPSIKLGKVVTKYQTDHKPYTHAPCPRYKVIMRQIRSVLSKA